MILELSLKQFRYIKNILLCCNNSVSVYKNDTILLLPTDYSRVNMFRFTYITSFHRHFDLSEGGGIAQLVSHLHSSWGPWFKSQWALDSDQPIHEWERKRLLAVNVIFDHNKCILIYLKKNFRYVQNILLCCNNSALVYKNETILLFPDWLYKRYHDLICIRHFISYNQKIFCNITLVLVVA